MADIDHWATPLTASGRGDVLASEPIDWGESERDPAFTGEPMTGTPPSSGPRDGWTKAKRLSRSKRLPDPLPPSRIDFAEGVEPPHGSALIVYRAPWWRRAARWVAERFGWRETVRLRAEVEAWQERSRRLFRLVKPPQVLPVRPSDEVECARFQAAGRAYQSKQAMRGRR